MEKNRTVQFFQTLESWRGIAALGIVIYHTSSMSSFYGNTFFTHSWLFVDFFFVLSGFIITHNYRQRVGTLKDFKTFIVLRLGRLYPLHIVTLFAFIIVKYAEGVGFGGRNSIEALVTNVFLLHSIGFGHDASFNEPSWSISTEFYTYIIFAIILLLTRKKPVLFYVAAIVMFAVFFIFETQTLGEFVEYRKFVRCGYGFFAGVIIRNIWGALVERKNLLTFIKGNRGFVTIIELATVLFMIFALAYPTDFINYRYMATISFCMIILVFATTNGAVSSLLNLGFFKWVGLISYSIYMTHFFINSMFSRMFLKFSRSINPNEAPFLSAHFGDFMLIANLIAVLIVAAISYRFIECYFRDNVKVYVKKRISNGSW